MINITVRLYKLHDYDLIFLYKNMRFPVRDAMKKALTAYVRKEPVFFDFPIAEPEDDVLKNLKNAQFHLKLDEEDDRDLIEYLGTIKRFYRNSFLKNLLRGYLAGPAVYSYENEITKESRLRTQAVQESILNISSLKLMKKRKRKDGK